MSLFRDAFTIYVKGYAKSKSLLRELKSHSKQFRLFLKETQTEHLNLDDLLDLPLVYLNETLSAFKEIRRFTCESKRNPTETSHIDSVIVELRTILAHSEETEVNLFYENDISITTTLLMGSCITLNTNNTRFYDNEFTESLYQSKTFQSKSSLTSSSHSEHSTEETSDQFSSLNSLLF